MKYLPMVFLFASSFAQAAYFVECGSSLNEDEATFKQVEFKASSQDEIFRGKNGDVWSVALRGDWLPSKSAKASVKEDAKLGKIINITISKGTGASEIGKRYEVVGMYDDYPTLNVYNVGGVAAGVKLKSFACYTAIM